MESEGAVGEKDLNATIDGSEGVIGDINDTNNDKGETTVVEHDDDDDGDDENAYDDIDDVEDVHIKTDNREVLDTAQVLAYNVKCII